MIAVSKSGFLVSFLILGGAYLTWGIPAVLIVTLILFLLMQAS